MYKVLVGARDERRQELGGVGVVADVAGVAGAAQGHGDSVVGRRQFKAEARDGLPDLLRDRAAGCLVGAAEDEPKLFAPEATDHVRSACTAAQQGPDRAEDGVTRRVSMLVIHYLEVVDVQHQDRDGCPAGRAERLGRAAFEVPSVGKPGEGVEVREALESGVGLLEVGHHARTFGHRVNGLFVATR